MAPARTERAQWETGRLGGPAAAGAGPPSTGRQRGAHLHSTLSKVCQTAGTTPSLNTIQGVSDSGDHTFTQHYPRCVRQREHTFTQHYPRCVRQRGPHLHSTLSKVCQTAGTTPSLNTIQGVSDSGDHTFTQHYPRCVRQRGPHLHSTLSKVCQTAGTTPSLNTIQGVSDSGEHTFTQHYPRCVRANTDQNKKKKLQGKQEVARLGGGEHERSGRGEGQRS